MNLADFQNLEFSNIGSWPMPARMTVIAVILVAVLGAGYWFDSKEQMAQLKAVEAKEQDLRSEFENKAGKAANLEAYEQQLDEMRVSFGAMLRQLPNKSEVADLLVDVSQAGLASGLEFQLFKPEAEVPREFYAELPISIEVRGQYHEFGAFISGIAALPRIVTVHDTLMEPAKNQGEDMLMRMTAKTYRYLEEEEAGEGAAVQ